MPPAISDDEASETNDVEVSIPSSRRGKKASVSYDDNDDDDEVRNHIENDQLKNGDDDGDAGEDDEEDDDDIGEDEFVVEKIVGHEVLPNGNIKYKVKWEGYEKKSDQTWEDEDNLKDNASLILSEYLESVGGRQQILEETETAASQKSAKKRGRPAASASGSGTPANGKRAKRGSHPASQTPPASASGRDWKPPAGSWEDEVSYVDACHDEHTGKLLVYLTWKNGHKTQHDLKVVYSRCPQQMLRFYERHVKIVKTTADANMET